MWQPLSVTKLRSFTVAPSASSFAFTARAAIGMTSTGSGKEPSTGTFFEASAMQTKLARKWTRRSFFARKRAPASLDHGEARIYFVGTVDVDADFVNLVHVEHLEAERFKTLRGALA